MRTLVLFFFAALISGCSFTDRGVRLDFPRPTVDVCLNAVSNDEVVEIKSKVERETFAKDKMKRARFHSKDRCFSSTQVMLLVDIFTFQNDRLELAKFLYTKTDDKQNYDGVIDLLTFSNDRDELREYIESI